MKNKKERKKIKKDIRAQMCRLSYIILFIVLHATDIGDY